MRVHTRNLMRSRQTANYNYGNRRFDMHGGGPDFGHSYEGGNPDLARFRDGQAGFVGAPLGAINFSCV